MKNAIIEYEQPDSAALVEEANNAFAIAKEIYIDSPAMYSLAANELSDIKARIKELNDKRVSITTHMDVAKKAVMDLFRPAIDRLEETKTWYQNGLIKFNDEQEKLRRAEQDRLDAVARAERFKIEEAARKATEEAAKLQADAAAKAALAKTPEAAAKIIAKAAEKIEAKQDEASALQLTSQVIVPATVAIAAKVSGTSVRKTWKAKVTDKAKFIQHVAAHPEFLAMIDINETLLNGMARAQQENLSLPGVQPYQESGIASRRN
jgi:hypothetical protein